MKKELELYESVILYKSTSADELSSNLENYKNFLTGKGSQVMIKNQGKVSLAYNVKGFDMATYVQIVYLGNGDLINQLNVELQRDESVLRTVTTRLLDDNIVEMFKSGVE